MDLDKSPGNAGEHGENNDTAYNRIKLRITVFDILLNLLLLNILAFSGISGLLVEYLQGPIRNSYLLFLAFMCVTALTFGVFEFPLDFYGGYIIEHRFGLSKQSISRWLLEKAKAGLVGIVIGVPVAMVFYFFLRISGELWWLYFSFFVFLIMVFLARIAPVIIFPIFYTFTELEEGEVKDRITSVLGDEKIRIKGIYSFNMSKDTRKANAGFTGIGKSKRIILSDTLLENFSPAEIAVIFSHEMGHYKKRHIVKNIIISTVMIFLTFYVCAVLYGMTLSVSGFTVVSDIAAVPILILYLSISGLVLMPLTNALSRRYEREADAYALEATGDNDSFISSMEKLARMNLSDIDPHPVKEFIFYSHPSIKKRIEFAKKGP